MNMLPIRANCFDTSALLKIFTIEEGSSIVRDFFNHRSPTKYTTPFCFYEALNMLKVKWLYRKEISQQEYMDAAFRLIAWFEASTQPKDIDLKDPLIFLKVRDLAERHSLDLSDAFQIVSVKEGYFSHLISDSKTILVTADNRLAKIAKIEGIKSWYFLGDPEPK